MCEFYEGWEDDWQSGYDMTTNEEWDEAHEPYDPTEEDYYNDN